MSITELAKNVGSSRPTITSRLKHLISDEKAIIHGGLNLEKMGFKMACVGLEVKNKDTRNRVEKILGACPRILNTFRTTGKANMHIAFWGEKDEIIHSTIESFRDIENVDIVYSHYLGTPSHGKIMVPIHPEKKEKTACNKSCSSCERYTIELCVGCPMTKDYKNPF